MKIEEAIKQTKPFRNLYQKAMVNLLYTSNWVEERLRELIKPYDITIQQYNVLRILRGSGKPLTTSVIRERLIDKMSDTSRMVDRLCKKGLVDRRQCCVD
ncbi:MAG: MarR family transcriptional regulator, partial [Saprospiraceae bacterium]|nr:MarR family transcriptional regulator [Saprospiraceae bacterium]